MRRGIAGLLFLVVTLTATGCRGNTAEVAPVGNDFTCTIAAEYKDMKLAGTLVRQTTGMLKLTFTEPDSLAGVTSLWDGETVQLQLDGMSFSVDPDAVPESALGEELIAALDAAVRGEGAATRENGQLVIRGTGSNGDYVLTCDPDTGVPQTLSVPALPLTVTFSGLQRTK